MTAAQVAEDDRLLAFDDKFVIDLSRMLGRHPGGDQCLYNNKLKDIGRHMKFHSKQGRTLIKAQEVALSGLEIGYLLAFEGWFRAPRTWRAWWARFLARTGGPLRAGRTDGRHYL
jgi:hypothetical protein